MGIHDSSNEIGNQLSSRRSFLRNSGLAALATAGAISTLDHAGATIKPATSESVSATSADMPESAQDARRAFLSLTVLAMTAVTSDKNFAQKVYDLALADLESNINKLMTASDTVNRLHYTPNPEDDCKPRPRWWGNPCWGIKEQFTPSEQIPAGGLVALDLYRSLDSFNMAFQYHDQALQAATLSLARGELSIHLATLKNMTSFATANPTNDCCPAWWPWIDLPIHTVSLGIPTPQPAIDLSALLKSLINFGLGKTMRDINLGQIRSKTFLGQIQANSRKMGGYYGNLTGWDEDGQCPKGWPWFGPFPRPWALDMLLDPFANEAEGVQWHKVGSNIARASSIFVIANTMRNRGIAQELRDVAIEHIQDQVRQLG